MHSIHCIHVVIGMVCTKYSPSTTMILDCDKLLQLHIISFLPHQSIASCESVCSYLKKLILSINYWQVICQKHENYILLLHLKGGSYKNYYHTLLVTKINPHTTKRIMKELNNLERDPPYGISAGPVKEGNIYHWSATMLDTPYAGGVFFLNVLFPVGYPFQPMKVKFVTPILHCNINTNGAISLDVLQDSWSPALSISKILLSIKSLLSEPNPDDPLNVELSNLMKKDEKAYVEKIKEHVKKYAM